LDESVQEDLYTLIGTEVTLKYQTHMKHMYNSLVGHPSAIQLKKTFNETLVCVSRFKPFTFKFVGGRTTNCAMLLPLSMHHIFDEVF
jgi:hypothetical protein